MDFLIIRNHCLNHICTNCTYTKMYTSEKPENNNIMNKKKNVIFIMCVKILLIIH